MVVANPGGFCMVAWSSATSGSLLGRGFSVTLNARRGIPHILVQLGLMIFC